MLVNNELEGVWVVRRTVPPGLRETEGVWYLGSAESWWDFRLSVAQRFGHRDQAVVAIASHLKRWPGQWGQIKPVRLVVKGPTSAPETP